MAQCVMEGGKPYEKPVVEAPPEIEEKLAHTVSELRFEPYVMETAMMETYKETVAMDDRSVDSRYSSEGCSTQLGAIRLYRKG